MHLQSLHRPPAQVLHRLDVSCSRGARSHIAAALKPGPAAFGLLVARPPGKVHLPLLLCQASDLPLLRASGHTFFVIGWCVC